MFSPGDLVAAQWCLYRVLIAESTWRYRDSDGGVLFVFICAYGWDEGLLLSSESRICRLATAHLVGVLCLSPRGVTAGRAGSSIGSTLISFGGCDGIQTR